VKVRSGVWSGNTDGVIWSVKGGRRHFEVKEVTKWLEVGLRGAGGEIRFGRGWGGECLCLCLCLCGHVWTFETIFDGGDLSEIEIVC